MAAAPNGSPGCPLFALCTASTDRKRSVLMQSSSKEAVEIVVEVSGLISDFLDLVPSNLCASLSLQRIQLQCRNDKPRQSGACAIAADAACSYFFLSAAMSFFSPLIACLSL